MKKILVVVAHPDDEAFGPGGTIAYYASQGVEIHLLCATKGEAGDSSLTEGLKENEKLQTVREKELLKSAEILGVRKVEFLDYIDGRLCNEIYHELADKILKKINDFQPQIVLTMDRLGISGHLDHIAVSMMTTFAFRKTTKAKKLYYNCLAKRYRDPALDKYFIYFPEGYEDHEITTRIDYSKVFEKKKAAMFAHGSQRHDAETILSWLEKIPKIDHFILQYPKKRTLQTRETDLFTGIS